MRDAAEIVPLLVTKQRAAQLLGISLRSVGYLLANKRLPKRRIGGRVLIPYAALLKFSRSDHPTK